MPIWTKWWPRRWRARQETAPTAQAEPASHENARHPPEGFTRAATWADVQAVARLLEQYDVEYVLIGGYALHANGLTRATTDIDIVVRNSPANNTAWITALGHLPDGAARVLDGERDPFRSDQGTDENENEPGTLRILDEIVVDVMPAACGLSYDDLKPYIARIEQDTGGVNVLTLDGLLLTKRGVRNKDLADRILIESALKKLRSWGAFH